jgi:hypothetical protein
MLNLSKCLSNSKKLHKKNCPESRAAHFINLITNLNLMKKLLIPSIQKYRGFVLTRINEF